MMGSLAERGAWERKRHGGQMSTAISRATLMKGARLAAAFAVTAGAFIATRQRYHGSCLFPGLPWEGDNPPGVERWLFYSLPIAFAFGFLWLMWEFVYPVLAARGMNRTGARLMAIGLALAIYAGVGFVGWMTTPDDAYRDIDYGGGAAKIIWSLWDIGILFRTGNFSPAGCGY